MADKNHRVLIVVTGGVTRCMEYLIESWQTDPRRPDHLIVDPRGVGSIAMSPLHWLKALATVARRSPAAPGCPMIVHANMCEYGSALLPRGCGVRAAAAIAAAAARPATPAKVLERLALPRA